MEKIIKEFKSLSVFLGGFSVIKVFDTMRSFSEVNTIDAAVLADAELAATGISTSTVLSAAKIMAIVPGILSVLALLFLCYKGIQEAKDPSSAKSHIIVATIMMVFYALAGVALLGEMISKPANLVMQGLEVLIQCASVALMVYYRKYAKQIRVVE